MNNFFANTVVEKIQIELTKHKIDTSIANQITDFLKPHLNNINFANLPQNAQNIKNQFRGFLQIHKDKIGEENIVKIQKTIDGIISTETLQKVQNSGLNKFKSRFPIILIIWVSVFVIFNALSIIGSVAGLEQNVNSRVFEKQALTETTTTSLFIYMIVNVITVILGIWLVIKFIKIKNKIKKLDEVKYSKVEKYLTICYYILPFLEFIFYSFYTQYDNLKFSTFLGYFLLVSPSLIIFANHLDCLRRLNIYNKNLELKK